MNNKRKMKKKIILETIQRKEYYATMSTIIRWSEKRESKCVQISTIGASQ
jgi:ribosomal protein S21